MKCFFIVFFLILTGKGLQAQFVTYQDGSPAKEIKLINVEGSELLYPDWIRGSVKLANGGLYSDLMLKYNLYEDQLYFLGKDNITMKFASPVFEFYLDKDLYRNGYPSIKNLTSLSFFHILVDGKVTLLKKISKNIIEVKEFNSATAIKKIVDEKNNYLFLKGSLKPLKTDKASLLDLFFDKKNEVDAYLKANKVNFKKDEDIVTFVKYYNSL